MNSCLYECNVMHYRVKPKKHKFTHTMFMFYFDLDEIDALSKAMPLFSRNRRNVYNFKDNDHIQFKGEGFSVKENVLHYLASHGVDLTDGRIMLLTNVRNFGYVFNPVSFYFCFDRNNKPVCVVPEVGNTFREMKPFFLGKELYQEGRFKTERTKHFYVSPFIELDVSFDFNLKVPDERLDIRIDDVRKKDKFFYTSLTGNKKTLSNRRLFWDGLRFPLVTLKVIFLIHLHAILLYLKKIPYYIKEDSSHLQKEVYNAWIKD